MPLKSWSSTVIGFIVRGGIVIRFAMIGIVLGYGLAIGQGVAARNCRAIYTEAQGLSGRADPAALKVLHAEALITRDCTDDFRRALGRRTARAMVARAERAIQGGSSAASQEALLVESLTYYRLWQVLASLGDIAAVRKDHRLATRRYQEALEVIDDTKLTQKAPPRRTIKAIFRKAEESRLLAATYVAAPRNRAGKPTGLGALSVRGFSATKIAVPITFKYNSVEFTEKGRAAATDLFAQLKAQNSPEITLVGHTDPRGSDTYNQGLSERRAATVAAFLKQRGYSGRVRSAGKGESEPFQPDDPGRYTRAELHQLHRRVDLLR